jgi:hypothetical protein
MFDVRHDRCAVNGKGPSKFIDRRPGAVRRDELVNSVWYESSLGTDVFAPCR